MATTAPAVRRTARPRSDPVSTDGKPLSVRIPASAHTFAGFRQWVRSDEFPEKLRAAFIDREIYLDMSKEDLGAHVLVKDEISGVLRALNKELGLGLYFGDGAQVSNPAAGVSNQPDATLLTDKSLRSGRVRLVPKEGHAGRFVEIEGSPDWVMEVISDSSVEKDTGRLREAYHRGGVREYWLIDARGEDLIFQVLLWRKNGYVQARVKGGWQRSRVFGREFRLERKRGRYGLWEYTLQMRPE